MYQVIKRTAENFVKGSEILGEVETWEEAHKLGLTVCADLAHEPYPDARDYWFSDISDPNEAYKVHIKKIAAK